MMDEGARRWLLKAARKNYWRVSSWYDLDDLIQEGYFAYYYTVRRYPKVKHPPHRMALFKLVFNSVICNLANARTRSISEVQFSALERGTPGGASDEIAAAFIDGVAADPSIIEALPALARAPEYVRRAVALFADGASRKALRAPYKATRGKPRETLNERICRLVGCDPREVDIVGGIKACLED